MQIARPHTRFFRLVYDSPKQSDILCGINIRIHIVSAISALERLVSSCADMVAHRASLRSICWFHDNQRHTRHSRLVFHKGAEFHRRADELFDFQFRRRLEFGTDVADEYKYTSTNKNYKKKKR